MKEEIKRLLQNIEAQHNVRIVYACESGSRGWGFESLDSDYDVRFVYLHQPDWYLSIDSKADIIELPIHGLLDVNGWDIKKVLLHLKKSNPVINEWFRSPMIYYENTSVVTRLRDLEKCCFNPAHSFHHYMNMGEKKLHEVENNTTIRIKDFFYILRPLLACEWILRYLSSPPMEFSQLFEIIKDDDILRSEIETLLLRKSETMESEPAEKNEYLLEAAREKVNYYKESAKTLHSNKTDCYEAMNEAFRDALKEYWCLYWSHT